MQHNCKQTIVISVIIRIIITIIVFIIIYKQKWNEKKLLVLLPIVLTFLDAIDNTYASYEEINLKCVLTRFHFYCDKFADTISYIFLFFLLKTDLLLSFFIIFRAIGIVLFLITKDNTFLIFFFDFVKEYLLYLFIFNTNMNYLFVFVALKLIFIIAVHYIIKKHNEIPENQKLKTDNIDIVLEESQNPLVAEIYS